MSVLPVIQRELRATARHPSTYWVRMGCGFLFAALFGAVMAKDLGPLSQSDIGAYLFACLNAALFVSLMLVVPVLAADCISRERREGTLGLLFLTPLSAEGIVVGKAACHALRAVSLFLVALPVLSVPLLLGGVSDHHLAMAAMLDLTLLVVALSAALVASSFCKDWTRPIVLSLVLTLVAVFVVFSIHWLVTNWLANSHPVWRLRGRVRWTSEPWLSAWESFSDATFIDQIELAFSNATNWKRLYWGWDALVEWQSLDERTSPEFPMLLLSWCAVLLLLSLLGLWLSVRLAAWRIRLAWQEAPPPLWQQQAARTFTRPMFMPGLLRSRLRGMLEKNPIGWLRQRTWSARTLKWGWCLAVILTECAIMADFQSQAWRQSWLITGQYVLSGMLLASMAFSAASSFRDERESGALELLLVTPLTPSQIIFGRLCGIWGQFFPALVLLAFGWAWLVYDLCGFMKAQWGMSEADLDIWTTHGPLAVLSGFLTVPVVGLYFSMQRMHVLAATAATICVCYMLLPVWMWFTSIFFFHGAWKITSWSVLMLLPFAQIPIAAVCSALLERSMKRRTFALKRD